MKYILAAKQRMLVTNSNFTFMIVSRSEMSVIILRKPQKSNNIQTRILEFSDLFGNLPNLKPVLIVETFLKH